MLSVSQMRAVDLAEMLREVLDVKIRKCRKEMLDIYMPIEVERIQAFFYIRLAGISICMIYLMPLG
jgi:hypothetical protein